MPLSKHFSKSSLDARAKFLNACAAANIPTTAFRCPATTPGGAGALPSLDESWWIDVARLGSPDAERVLILCCGFNGEEGYCGSGILVGWIAEARQRDLLRDVAVVLVHGVNPGQLTVLSAQLNDAIPAPAQTRGWTDKVLAAAERRFTEYANTSQNEEDPSNKPDSTNIWVEKILDPIAEIIVMKAKYAALIEFHTDLSPFGEVAIFSCHESGSVGDTRVGEWFGADALTQPDGPATADVLLLNLAGRLSALDLTSMVVEFGVYSTQLLLAIEPPKTTADRRERYKQLFYPESPQWRNNVSKEAVSIIRRVIKGLDAL
ncbi:MAG: hypothetical protein ACJAU6_001423 [Alphaproteobacteria bacterium]|jgi:hypothetical protein